MPIPVSQGRSWRITDFDVTKLQMYKDFEKVRGAIGTETCPTTQRKHLQIFITFRRKYTFKQLKKIVGDAHIEISKTNDWNYEIKEGNYELEDNRQQGKRSDLDEARESLAKRPCMREVIPMLKSVQAIRMCELILNYSEPERPVQKINVIWCYGPSGSGKTRWAHENYEDLFRPVSFKFWQGYDGHASCLIDDFRRDWCTFKELILLLDIYPYRKECKGGSRQIQATTFIITCPWKHTELYRDYTEEDLYQLTRRITEIKHFENIQYPRDK